MDNWTKEKQQVKDTVLSPLQSPHNCSNQIDIGLTVKQAQIDLNSQDLHLKYTVNVKMDGALVDEKPSMILQDEELVDLSKPDRTPKKLSNGLVSLSFTRSQTIKRSSIRDLTPFELSSFELKFKVNTVTTACGERRKLRFSSRCFSDYLQFQSRCLSGESTLNGNAGIDMGSLESKQVKMKIITKQDTLIDLNLEPTDTIVFHFDRVGNLLENMSRVWFPVLCVLICGFVFSSTIDAGPEEYVVDLLLTIVFITRSRFGTSTALVYMSGFVSALSNAVFHNSRLTKLIVHSLCTFALIVIFTVNNVRKRVDHMKQCNALCPSQLLLRC
jgi:hypothetical protein